MCWQMVAIPTDLLDALAVEEELPLVRGVLRGAGSGERFSKHHSLGQTSVFDLTGYRICRFQPFYIILSLPH